MEQDGRTGGVHVHELEGPIPTGHLKQQPRREQGEQDRRYQRRPPILHPHNHKRHKLEAVLNASLEYWNPIKLAKHLYLPFFWIRKAWFSCFSFCNKEVNAVEMI